MLNCLQIHVELGDGLARIAKQHNLGRETLVCLRTYTACFRTSAMYLFSEFSVVLVNEYLSAIVKPEILNMFYFGHCGAHSTHDGDDIESPGIIELAIVNVVVDGTE